MEYAKKMTLVDPRIIEKLTSARDKDLNSIENEIDTVLIRTFQMIKKLNCTQPPPNGI